jgi:hypothetical protein
MRPIIVSILVFCLSSTLYAQKKSLGNKVDFSVKLADSIDRGHDFSVDVTQVGCFQGTKFVIRIRKVGAEYYASQVLRGYNGGKVAPAKEEYRLLPSQIDSLHVLELELMNRAEEVKQVGGFEKACTTKTEYRIHAGKLYKEYVEQMCTTFLQRLMAAMRRL